MLIIAVLVGARGLAEQVNIGLRDANTGLGITAGLSMAFIAIIADRILRGWAARLAAVPLDTRALPLFLMPVPLPIATLPLEAVLLVPEDMATVPPGASRPLPAASLRSPP